MRAWAWVEHDGRDPWSARLTCAPQVQLGTRIDAAQVARIGIANQRETIVLWGHARGAPIASAIVW